VVADGNGKPQIQIPNGGPKLTPEEVAAVILGEMKRIAEVHLKREVSRAIVTVPAYFSDAQRQATKDAGAIAGLNVLRVINEPTAAALAYGLDARSLNNKADDSERKILVFDLGGGTFDVSVLAIDRGVFEVMATGGDTHLGGEDFDNNVVDYLLAEIKKQFDVKDLDQKAKSRLRVAAEQAKIALSSAQSTRVPLDGIVDGKTLELTRAKFEKLNEEPFKRCLDTVKRVMKDAKVKTDDVGDIVLVGGSTRIPVIREKLRELFGGRQLCQSINPDEAVAYGAAVQGAIMQKTKHASTSQLILVDVTPLSLGIECTGKIFSAVIPRNTPLPVQRQKVYSTEEDYQTAIDVRIFEGERQCTDGNNLLGEFRIDGIERAKRGEPKVEVSFTVSVDGILTVSARDLVTGVSGKVSIAANSGRLSEADIANMLADAEKFRKADADRAERQEAMNDLEHLIAELAESGKYPTALKNTREWLDNGGDALTTKNLKAKALELQKKVSSE
jgi:heat shock protein 1/8